MVYDWAVPAVQVPMGVMVGTEGGRAAGVTVMGKVMFRAGIERV